MRKRMSFLVSAAALLSVGWPSFSDVALGDSERDSAKNIEVLSGAPDRPFDVIATVTGKVCHRNAFAISDAARLKEAKELREKAAALGADAVVDTVCQTIGGQSFLKNCWESYQCTGQAVRYK